MMNTPIRDANNLHQIDKQYVPEDHAYSFLLFMIAIIGLYDYAMAPANTSSYSWEFAEKFNYF